MSDLRIASPVRTSPVRVSCPFALLLICVSLGSGCGLATNGYDLQDFELRDHGATFPAVRMSIDTSPEGARARAKLREERDSEGEEAATLAEDEDSERERTSTSRRSTQRSFVDVELTLARGESEQTLSTNEAILLDDLLVTGPGDAKNSADMRTLSVAYRFGPRLGRWFSIDGIIGAEGYSLRLESELGTRKDSVATFQMGPLVGLRLGLHPFENVEIYGRGTYSIGLLGDDEFEALNHSTLEAGVAFTIMRNVTLIGGWRSMQLSGGASSSFEDLFADFDASDLDMKMSGPMVALQVNF